MHTNRLGHTIVPVVFTGTPTARDNIIIISLITNENTFTIRILITITLALAQPWQTIEDVYVWDYTVRHGSKTQATEVNTYHMIHVPNHYQYHLSILIHHLL